jgi:serine protease
VYLVFWGSQWGTQGTDGHGYATFSGDPDAMASDLQAFYAGLGTAGDTWSGVVTQYCEGVIAGTEVCPPYASHVGYPTGGALAGVWEDTTAAAPGDATWAQLQAEALSGATHFGNTTPASNRDTQYVLVSPTGTTPDGFVASGFCAWHDYAYTIATPSAPSVSVAFTNLPYIPDVGYECGANFVNPGPSGLLDGVTIVAGHEYAETLTDQFPDGGWVDNAGAETGDKCVWIRAGQGAAQNIALATGSFAVQSLWSNDLGSTGGCEMSHPVVNNDLTPRAPAITSPDHGAVAGIGGRFTVTTTGYPTPKITEAATLPTGVTVTDNGNGTASVAITAALDHAGSYPMSLIAANGVGSNATQQFTLDVTTGGGLTTTFAGIVGDTIFGNGGDGGPALGAQFGFPSGLAVDPSGAVYISDTNNNRVRKVTPDGIISDFAGSAAGTAGNTGDGGPATAALLDRPQAVVVDEAGNVYIDDEGNNRIRKVTPDGTITNFAGSASGTAGNSGDGGPATSAAFYYPDGLALDAAGNLYISDTGNARVRKVAADGTVTDFAGSILGTRGNGGDGGPATLATLDYPEALAVDATGNVYIPDEVDHRVRKVAPDGTIANFAGSASAFPGNDGDGGPATSATLQSPSAVAIDPSGNVYIVDRGAYRIRVVNIQGTITNYAGSFTGVDAGAAWSAGDGGAATSAVMFPSDLAFDPAGDLYVADGDLDRVREVASPAVVTSPATAPFTVDVPGSFTVTASSGVVPAITLSGSLPAGVTFNATTATLSGTPSQGTKGTYPVTLTSAVATGPTASQRFTLSVDQAALTYPTNGQTLVDTTQPLAWSTIPEAQGYLVTVGTAAYGTNLVNSGVLPATQSSYPMPALPAGPTLNATLYAEVNGGWTSYQAITFTAAAGEAMFTSPVNGQTGVDPTAGFTWATSPGAQGYLLAVGTTPNGTDLLVTGALPASQTHASGPVLPAGKAIYATLLTKTNGGWTRFQAITFTARAPIATLTHPVNGQTAVVTPTAFTWVPIAGAQNYVLVIGTTPASTNVLRTGLIAPTATGYAVGKLAVHQRLYATLLTEVNGSWAYQTVAFGT